MKKEEAKSNLAMHVFYLGGKSTWVPDQNVLHSLRDLLGILRNVGTPDTVATLRRKCEMREEGRCRGFDQG